MLFTDTLASSGTSDTFQVTNTSTEHPISISVIGSLNGATVKLQQSFDKSTWTDLYDGATLVEYSTSGEQDSLDLAPGYYQFVAGSITSATVRASGKYLTTNV